MRLGLTLSGWLMPSIQQRGKRPGLEPLALLQLNHHSHDCVHRELFGNGQSAVAAFSSPKVPLISRSEPECGAETATQPHPSRRAESARHSFPVILLPWSSSLSLCWVFCFATRPLRRIAGEIGSLQSTFLKLFEFRFVLFVCQVSAGFLSGFFSRTTVQPVVLLCLLNLSATSFASSPSAPAPASCEPAEQSKPSLRLRSHRQFQRGQSRDGLLPPRSLARPSPSPYGFQAELT